MTFWDDPEVERAAAAGSYHALKNEGDVAEGVIAELGMRTFDEGKANERQAIEITFADGSILTAGQVKLMGSLVEMRPDVGDYLTVELARIEARGAKTLKHFKITVSNARANGTPGKVLQSVDHTAE